MITIHKGPEQLAFKSWVFPDGALGIRLDTDNHRYREGIFEIGGNNVRIPKHQTIVARIQSSQDVMELLMVTEALRAWDSTPIRLVLPCLAYQRQDRRCCAGESHSLKVFAGLINGLGFESVTVFDLHSDVAGALIDRINIIDQKTVIGRFDALNKRLQPTSPADRPLFVSPDAGSNKKTSELAGLYSHDYFIRADKLRELATGKIKEIVVVNPREEVEGRQCVIVDDLGDRMGTFIGLAKALKAKGAASVEVYITHALLTLPNPIDVLAPLYAAGVDRVWATNSYRTDLEGISPNLTVLNLESVFTL